MQQIVSIKTLRALPLSVITHRLSLPLSDRHIMSALINWLGGNFRHAPENFKTQASTEAQEIVQESFADIGTDGVWDHHTHLGGIGTNDTGCCVHESMHQRFKVHKRIKFHVFM